METRFVARNSLLIFGGHAFGALTTMITLPLLARYLGQAGYGRYSYTYAFVGLFEALSVLGLDQIVLRESARHRAGAGRYLGHALRIKSLLSFGTFLLIAAANLLVNDASLRPVVLICGAEVLVRMFFDVNIALSRAFERMEYELLIVTINEIVRLIGVLIVIGADLGIVALFVAFLAGSVVQALVGTVIVWRKVAHPDPRWVPGMSKRLLKEACPIGLTEETWHFYRRQGTVLLGQWHGAQTVGLYSAGYRMYQLTAIVADSLIGAIFPIFSRLATSSRERLTASFNSALRYLLLAGLLIAIGCWAFAPQIVAVLLGPQFDASVDVLRWLSPAIVLTFMNTVFRIFLRATDKQWLETLNTGTALLVNLGMNLALVPAYGLMGTVWALLVSEGVACFLGGYLSASQVEAVAWRRSVVAPLLGGLAAVAVLFALRGVSPFLAMPVAGVSFAWVAFALHSHGS